MSHHFDTPTAQEDPRINICDFYLFDGRPGTTVMAMTVNPDAGVSAPDTFREEGIYAFRFDLDGDARAELAIKVMFGPVTHGEGPDHAHVQRFEVRRATGPAAIQGVDGDILATGETGTVAETDAGVKVFAGLAPDLFAGDAAALGAFRNAFFKEGRFAPEAFHSATNFFAGRNVTAIVVEMPSHLIGAGLVHGWATISLHGHAPEVQVSRWGLPLITNIFMPDLDMREDFNRAAPTEDRQRFGTQISGIVEKLTMLAGSTANPTDYAGRVVDRLCPSILPYELATAASFEAGRFNGRGLADDAMDVILALGTNTGLGDGVAPDRARIRDDFPYFGAPYSDAEQADLKPARPATKK